MIGSINQLWNRSGHVGFSAKSRRRGPCRFLPRLEQLEDRRLLSISPNLAPLQPDDLLEANNPPALESIGDQTMSHTQDTLDITLSASDADGDTLSYSTEAFSAPELAYQLDQELGLHSARDDHYFNHRGYGEKYFRSADSTWYYMLSGGELYRWGGSIQNSTLLATLGPQYHADPSLLLEAQAPVASISDQVTIGLSGSTLTIDPVADYTGEFFVRANASDGLSTSGETFGVIVTEAESPWIFWPLTE